MRESAIVRTDPSLDRVEGIELVDFDNDDHMAYLENSLSPSRHSLSGMKNEPTPVKVPLHPDSSSPVDMPITNDRSPSAKESVSGDDEVAALNRQLHEPVLVYEDSTHMELSASSDSPMGNPSLASQPNSIALLTDGALNAIVHRVSSMFGVSPDLQSESGLKVQDSLEDSAPKFAKSTNGAEFSDCNAEETVPAPVSAEVSRPIDPHKNFESDGLDISGASGPPSVTLKDSALNHMEQSLGLNQSVVAKIGSTAQPSLSIDRSTHHPVSSPNPNRRDPQLLSQAATASQLVSQSVLGPKSLMSPHDAVKNVENVARIQPQSPTLSKPKRERRRSDSTSFAVPSFLGIFSTKKRPSDVHHLPKISAPDDFRHISHVNGSDLSGLPQEWRSLFDKAGVTGEHLKDEDTARFFTLLFYVLIVHNLKIRV